MTEASNFCCFIAGPHSDFLNFRVMVSDPGLSSHRVASSHAAHCVSFEGSKLRSMDPLSGLFSTRPPDLVSRPKSSPRGGSGSLQIRWEIFHRDVVRLG